MSDQSGARSGFPPAYLDRVGSSFTDFLGVTAPDLLPGRRPVPQIPVGDIVLEVLHTPGHAPGAVCFYAPGLGVVFTGDTLFNGGPGATGRSFSDHDLIVASIKDRLMSLPGDTVVKTGHGDDTTIEAERGNLD